MKTDDILIYTDGSCLRNPGAGGYGAVILSGSEVIKELSGGYAQTTNNRMELMAVIKALTELQQLAPDARAVTVYSDSAYIVDAFTKNWVQKWLKRHWRTASGEPVKNRDLWVALVDLVERHAVQFQKVAAHTGDEYNERADALAVAGARSGNHEIDRGFAPENGSQLTHIDQSGNVQMVDISEKPATARHAVAAAQILMQPATLQKIYAGDLPKGDVLATARIAAVSASKAVHSVIPLCHQIPLTGVEVDFQQLTDGMGLSVQVGVRAHWSTGVEMEALYATSVAALTIYDMCKAVDKTMQITGLKLLSKTK